MPFKVKTAVWITSIVNPINTIGKTNKLYHDRTLLKPNIRAIAKTNVVAVYTYFKDSSLLFCTGNRKANPANNTTYRNRNIIALRKNFPNCNNTAGLGEQRSFTKTH